MLLGRKIIQTGHIQLLETQSLEGENIGLLGVEHPKAPLSLHETPDHNVHSLHACVNILRGLP